MTTTLQLARVGAGKTESAQRRLLAIKAANPFAKIWVLLSTERQINDFRRRLTVEHGRVLFNIEFFTFYPLYNRLLKLAGTPQRCLDDTARYGLLREVLRGMSLDVYKGIALTPGFIRVCAALIYELKQNLITPEVFELAADNAKERELARIYAAYQAVLRQHDLVDREGEGWLAYDALSNQRGLAKDVDLLIVDGYDQFNLLQSKLLAQLGARVRETLITLTTVAGREDTMGRRFARARERLEESHDSARFAVSVTPPPPLPEFGEGRQHTEAALHHLSDQLLRPKPIPFDGETSAVRLLEAPDPTAEAALILRRVKRLLLDGVSPDAILIAVRDWTLYGDAFTAAGRAYGIPLAIHYGEPLARNPAITALLSLLDLHKSNFRRRDLFDVLRSPYFTIPGIDAAAVDQLERAANDALINAGREAWLDAVDLLAQPATEDEDGESTSVSGLDPDEAARLKAALAQFFAAITPPKAVAPPEAGDAQTYVEWLEALIGHDAPDPDEDEPPNVPEYTLKVPDAIRRIPDARFTPLMERDLAALSEFKGLLRGLLSAASLFSALKLDGGYPPDVFLRDVRIAVEGAAYQRGKVRDGRVLITSVSDARGLPHDHVFIPGMAEGVFPAPTPEDPLLLDSERARLQANGVELPTQAERADDEGLFYELIGLARESLTLSRPCYKNGEVWAESHLYRAVRVVFPAITPEQVRIGAVIAPDDVATRGEACVTAISGAPGLRAWLASAHGDDWARVELGQRIELGRLSREPHDRYTGRLADETLVGQIGAWLSPSHRWSATQLGEYGVCGFKFFTRRLLRLEALETPEEGMDARQLGVLLHEILEKTYGQIGAEGLTITPPNAERARAILDEIAADVLRAAPRKLRFRPSALWSEEQAILLRRLRLLIETDFSGDSPIAKVFSGERTPYRQEARFPDGAALDLGGERLRLTGIIDRIDRSGDRAVIIDYKSGGTEIPTTEIEVGRNFQMLVYLAAAESLLDGLTPDAGVFWHLSNRKTSGVLTPDDPVIEQGKDHLRRMLESARRGQFDAHANGMDEGKCARVCDYAQFCRVAMTAQNKGGA